MIPPLTTNAPIKTLLLAVWLATATAAPCAADSLRPSTYRQLSAVHEQIDRQAYGPALTAVKALLADVDNHAYEKAVTLQTLGYIQIGREAYPEAVAAFEQSLALDRLPGDTQQRIRYDLAQLCLNTGKAGRAVELLKVWFENAGNPGADAHALLGYAYAQNKQYRVAIKSLQRALQLAKTPRADWYEVLLAMHYEIEAYKACIPLLKDMLRLFPERRRYWQQLAGVYMALNDHRAAITALELALRDGALTREQELIQLVQLYLHAGIPYKGARLLEKEIETGRIADNAKHRKLLAQAWAATGERKQAVRALEQALDTDTSAELRLQLAQWYCEDERWQAAEKILLPLVKRKGNNRIKAQSWLLLGIARFERGAIDAAQGAFARASELPRTKEAAGHWLRYIETLLKDNA